MAATPAAERYQADHAHQAIDKAVWHGAAHIHPPACRTTRTLIHFAGSAFHGHLQRSRVHQRSNTVAAIVATRPACACGSMGPVASRRSPQAASWHSQPEMIAGVTSRWNCKAYTLGATRKA